MGRCGSGGDDARNSCRRGRKAMRLETPLSRQLETVIVTVETGSYLAWNLERSSCLWLQSAGIKLLDPTPS